MAYYKGLNRWNYFQRGALNPFLAHPRLPEEWTALAAHLQLSEEYQAEYEGGNAAAIFQYARADAWALRAPWVVRQIENWRLENTAANRRNLEKFWRAYTGDHGSRKQETLKRLIKRDQLLFKDVIILQENGMPLRESLDSEGCFRTVAKKYKVKTGTVEEVYQHYKPVADRMMGKLLEPDIGVIEYLRQKGSIPPDQEPSPPPVLLSTWDEVFAWLDEMAARL